MVRDTGSIKEKSLQSLKKNLKLVKKIKGRAFLIVGEIIKFTPVPEINCTSIVKVYQTVPHSLTFFYTLHTRLELKLLLSLQVSKACESSEHSNFLFHYKNKRLAT